jgi:hypothetical protein
MNDVIIEIMKDHFTKTQENILLDQILIIIDKELKNGKKRHVLKNGDVTLEKWFMKGFNNNEDKNKFLLRWLETIIMRDLEFSQVYNLDQKEISKKWEQYIKKYGLIRASYEINYDALEQMFLDQLKEHFTLEKTPKIFERHLFSDKEFCQSMKDELGDEQFKDVQEILQAYDKIRQREYHLIPYQDHVPNIVVKILKKFSELDSEELKHLISVYTTVIISPIVNFKELPKEAKESFTSESIIMLNSLVIKEYEKIVSTFNYNLMLRQLIVENLLQYCTKKELKLLYEMPTFKQIYDFLMLIELGLKLTREKYTPEGVKKIEKTLEEKLERFDKLKAIKDPKELEETLKAQSQEHPFLKQIRAQLDSN